MPWTAPAPDHPVKERVHATSTQDTGRVRIDAVGADAGALAAIDAFRRAGATRVAMGWDAQDAPDDAAEEMPPAGVAVTWWVRVTFPDRVEEGRSAPTTDHPLGLLEAAAVVLRQEATG